MFSALMVATVLAGSGTSQSQAPVILPSGEVFTIFEKIEKAPLTPAGGKNLLSECEIRLIGRSGLVVLDTESRGMTYWVESQYPPTSLIDLAIAGLGAGGSRVMSQPDTGLFIWVTVVRQRSS